MTNIKCSKSTNPITNKDVYEVQIVKYDLLPNGSHQLSQEMHVNQMTYPEYKALYEAIGEVLNTPTEEGEGIRSEKKLPDNMDESLKEPDGNV